MPLPQDLTLKRFQTRPQDSSSLEVGNTNRKNLGNKRMISVPLNKISTRPSLGSFSSLKNLQSKPTNIGKGLSNNVGTKENSTWETSSTIKSIKPSNLRLQTSNGVKAFNTSGNSFLTVAGHSAKVANRVSFSGGITLKDGRDWETSKRPVITISSSEMRRDNIAVDAQGNKRLKRDRDGKPLFQQVNESKEPRTLQSFFDEMLTSRGYSAETFCALESGYHAKPTPLQKASYGLHLVQAIRSSDVAFISKYLKCGVSLNPCNMFGESIIHMVCRRGNYKLLKTFIDGGCSVQVSDDFGRTPLHDACWTSEPCFKSIELVLDKDIRLLNIRDCRGFTPLNYVKKENWSKWIEFLNSKRHIYWAHRDKEKLGEQKPPLLTTMKPNMFPVKDPPNATTVETASMLASGAMSPDEILQKESTSDRKTDSSQSASPLICA